MTLQQAFLTLKNNLATIYDTSEAAHIADWVMEHLTGKNKLQRMSSEKQLLDDTKSEQLSVIEKDLMRHRPVQYVLGKSYFGDMILKVDENVLIPRPETEELVAWAVMVCRQMPDIKAIDIGTGSGSIALSIKKQLPAAQVTAIDVSDEALNIAMENAAKYGLDITFSKIDFLDILQRNKLPVYDLIISNPPYIGLDEKESILPNVLDYEPHSALFVTNNDPLQFYKAIEQFGKDHLAKGGQIFCELHRDYATATQEYFQSQGWDTELKKDMQQNDRMLRCTR